MHDGTLPSLTGLEALRLGRLAGPAANGAHHLVEGPDGPLSARSLVPIRPQDRGREVAYALAAGGEALIVGLLQEGMAAEPDELRIDSPRKVRLTCGAASITLYPDGRVVIRGSQILSRAEGTNRILGGSVHLN